MKPRWTPLLGLLLCGAVSAAPMHALDDEELSGVTGGAVGIAFHLEINNAATRVADSRIYWGFTDANNLDTFLVVNNLSGVIDAFAITIDLKTRPEGGSDYVEIGLPAVLRFTNFGFESLSVQANPHAPITGNLGRFEIDGQLSFTGQLRIWPNN